MKRIIIVDADDQIIGHKERHLIQPEDKYRVSALWITNSRGDILLAKRSQQKERHPGKWGPAVAGTVEEGESYDDNIKKETEEELGVTSVTLTRGPKTETLGPHNHFTRWYFLTLDRSIEDFKIEKNEVEEIRWVPKDELMRDIKVNPGRYLDSIEQWITFLVNE
ncbi:MAG: NUDIX domain-containing protein [bacterium]|nr:NUDIX domain-containing protein [bacterium]